MKCEVESLCTNQQLEDYSISFRIVGISSVEMEFLNSLIPMRRVLGAMGLHNPNFRFERNGRHTPMLDVIVRKVDDAQRSVLIGQNNPSKVLDVRVLELEDGRVGFKCSKCGKKLEFHKSLKCSCVSNTTKIGRIWKWIQNIV